jgi:hypothetical protein
MKKRSIFLAILLLAAAALLSACVDSDYDQEAAFTRIKDQLKLNDEQARQLKPIYESQLAQAKTILENAKNERPSAPPEFNGQKPTMPARWQAGARPGNPLAAKLQPVTQEAESQLSAFLSAQQIADYNALLKADLDNLLEKNKPSIDDNHSGGGPGGFGSGPGGFGGGPGGFGGGRPNW